MCQTLTPWEKTIQFHGHVCPGLAIGYQMAAGFMRRFEKGYPLGDQGFLIAHKEFCGIDSLQVITGCTKGKGNLIVADSDEYKYLVGYRLTKKAFMVQLQKPLIEKIDRWQELYPIILADKLKSNEKMKLMEEIAQLTEQANNYPEAEGYLWRSINYSDVQATWNRAS